MQPQTGVHVDTIHEEYAAFQVRTCGNGTPRPLTETSVSVVRATRGSSAAMRRETERPLSGPCPTSAFQPDESNDKSQFCAFPLLFNPFFFYSYTFLFFVYLPVGEQFYRQYRIDIWKIGKILQQFGIALKTFRSWLQ